MREEGSGDKKGCSKDRKAMYVGFGIPALDEMLAGDPKAAMPGELPAQQRGFDLRGLPCGSETALIRDPGTNKSGLGIVFLSRAFFDFANRLKERYFEDTELRESVKSLTGKVLDELRAEQSFSASIVITTYDLNEERLIKRFEPHLFAPLEEEFNKKSDAINKRWSEFERALKEHIKKRLTSRRLEIHDFRLLFCFISSCNV
jgi:hypothetical protein